MQRTRTKRLHQIRRNRRKTPIPKTATNRLTLFRKRR
jgi:hypothetical protein